MVGQNSLVLPHRSPVFSSTNPVEQSARRRVDDRVACGESKDETGACLRRLASGAPDTPIEKGNNEQLAPLKFRSPVRLKLEGIEPAGGADDDGLGTAQEDAEALLLNRRVKAAYHGAVLRAPALSEVHRRNNLGPRARLRTKQCVERLIKQAGIPMRPEPLPLPLHMCGFAYEHAQVSSPVSYL